MRRAVLLAAALLALAGCSKSEHSSTTLATSAVTGKGDTPTNSNVELGRKIYNFRCYYCHGYSGDARTLAATFINPKPVDFTHTSPQTLDRDRMLTSVQHGRPGTAMMSFSDVLKQDDIAAVVDFIRHEFMVAKAENTRYHTPENGWFNHDRYAAAFPFAMGELPLDTPWEQLTQEQANGKRLFLTSCVTCHDRGTNAKQNNTLYWESRPVSYPRNQYQPGDAAASALGGDNKIDAMASASPYLIHDRPPKLSGLTETELHGEILFQGNCAFCHAADGTARNWIGSFMQPHPRNLTDPAAMSGMTKTRLHNVIRDGLPGTSMPAWKTVLSEQDIEAVIAYVNRAFHPIKPE